MSTDPRPRSIAAILEEMSSSFMDEPTREKTKKTDEVALKKAFAEFVGTAPTNERFKPGDIVDWREGYANRKTNGPYVVTKVLTEPRYETKDCGAPSFYEPLDLVIMCHVCDEWLEYHVDGRRMEHYNAE